MPIDDPKFWTSDKTCPQCGELLDYYPDQKGPCHSGLFIDSMTARYWCVECEDVFEPEEIEIVGE